MNKTKENILLYFNYYLILILHILILLSENRIFLDIATYGKDIPHLVILILMKILPTSLTSNLSHGDTETGPQMYLIRFFANLLLVWRSGEYST
jgi:hypothetical protein